MKVGVLGTGSMGRNHVRVYSELKGIDEIFVFDLNRASMESMKELEVTLCGSAKELLGSVDAVSICVPTKYHLAVAGEAIEKNVHCLIEKPLTLTVDEGTRLAGMAKNEDIVVGVGHIERFNPIVKEIARIVENPLFVEMKRHNPASSRITDSSVVEDLMIHDIDIVFNVLFNNGAYRLYSAGTPDVCKALVAFNGSVVTLSASRKSSKKIRSIYIETDDFTVEGDFMTQEIYSYYKPEKYGMDNERYTQENIIEKVLVNKVEPLKVELKTFVDCIQKGTEFPVTPEQALNNLRISEEIKKGF